MRIIHNARECAVLDEIECRVFTRLGGDGKYVLSLIQRAVAERFAALCHSKRFYDFLLKVYPDYFKWNDLLKEK